ncbi:MAG: tetratricopeptide repeat protein, partial [Acidobacteriota bacterium]
MSSANPQPGLPEWLAKATDHHRQGRFKQAAENYRRHLAAHPDDAAVWTNLGVALRQVQSFRAAVACQRRAVELAPNNPVCLGNLGNVLCDLGELDEAIARHQRAVELRPNEASPRHNLAVSLREAKRFKESLEQLEQADRLGRGGSIELDRSICLLHLGEFEAGWKANERRWEAGQGQFPASSVARWRGTPFPHGSL